MFYTIIVATYNRENEIRELLTSANFLDFPKGDFEIIVVDDGSCDNTKSVIEEFQQMKKVNIRYLFQKNRGPAFARNHGMSVAFGRYFLFVDSDCILPSIWLKRVDEFLSKNRNIHAFGGADDAHHSFSPLLKAINFSMTSFLGTAGSRGSNRSIVKYYPRSFNMGIDKKVYKTIGGMADLRHGQDMEYSARIYKSGFNVSFIPGAFVYHKRRTNLKRFFKQVFNFGNTRWNLAKADKSMLKPIHFLPTIILILALFSILLAIILKIIPIFLVLLILLCLICSLIFILSFLKYKSIFISFLSIITTFTQVSAYALGFLIGGLQSITKSKIKGFTKNYYK